METKEFIELQKLTSEQKILENQISAARKRISEIRAIIQGSNETPGLSAVVEVQRRKQEWIDGEPARAAMRATPEWQEWFTEFMKTKGKNIR
jgi:hypothetical protein